MKFSVKEDVWVPFYELVAVPSYDVDGKKIRVKIIEPAGMTFLEKGKIYDCHHYNDNEFIDYPYGSGEEFLSCRDLEGKICEPFQSEQQTSVSSEFTALLTEERIPSQIGSKPSSPSATTDTPLPSR